MKIEPLHYQRVEGANTTAIPGTQEIHTAVAALKDKSGLLLIDGCPGTGKTFGTQLALKLAEHPAHWADMSGNPLGKEAVARIYGAVMDRKAAPRLSEYLLLDDTVEALAESSAIVVIDEAHGMSRPALRQLRYLFDRPTTNSLVVLVGAGIDAKVKQVPELDSRVTWKIQISTLEPKESIDFARAFHKIFENSSSDVLALLHKTAKGYLRTWAKILFQAQILKVNPKKGISPAEASAILKNLGVKA